MEPGPSAGSRRDEDPVVRQYRFLLRQAPPDAVEKAHAEALTRLGEEQRRAILTAIQGGLVAGHRLHVSDTTQMAHLIVLGERRAPRAFMSACEPATLLALSQSVTRSDACFGLFGPYAAWDGVDPVPEGESALADDGFNPDNGRWNPARTKSKAWESDTPGGFSGGLPDVGGF
jgi:hypothetical protein